MRSLLAVAILCFATVGLAADPLAADLKVQRDVAYAEPKNERQTLDVFAPANGAGHPVVFWIHGGGWRQGDKQGVQQKPQFFTDNDYVFVATNYRFVPQVSVKEMTADIARAIRWTHDHAPEFGGDPTSIYVMGHSAGAHLAALVCTDDRYLKAEGLSLEIVKGCVPVDSAAYDVPKRLQDDGETPPAAFFEVFGTSTQQHRELSPVAHIAAGKHVPPFLILHVAGRAKSKVQSLWFADRLKAVGIWNKVVAGEGKTHGTINADLGAPGDKPTQEVLDFLNLRSAPRSSSN